MITVNLPWHTVCVAYLCHCQNINHFSKKLYKSRQSPLLTIKLSHDIISCQIILHLDSPTQHSHYIAMFTLVSAGAPSAVWFEIQFFLLLRGRNQPDRTWWNFASGEKHMSDIVRCGLHRRKKTAIWHQSLEMTIPDGNFSSRPESLTFNLSVALQAEALAMRLLRLSK